jgi:hypothetical protein
LRCTSVCKKKKRKKSKRDFSRSENSILTRKCPTTTTGTAYRGWGGNPGTLNTWLRNNGGYAGGCNIYWCKVDSLGHSRCMGNQTPTYQEVCNGVGAGHGIVIHVRSGTHYVLVTGCAGNGVYYVNDPASFSSTYAHSGVSQWVVYH